MKVFSTDKELRVAEPVGHDLWLVILILVLLCSLSFSSYAQDLSSEPIILDKNIARVSLGQDLKYLEDATNQYTLGNLPEVSGDAWSRLNKASANFGYTDSAYWIHFNLFNPDYEMQSRLLEIAYPLLDDIQVYVFSGGEAVLESRLGDLMPFDRRPVNHNFFLQPLEIPARADLEVYLRVTTTSSFQVPLTLWDSQAYFAADQQSKLFMGFFFGAMIIVILYNLFILFSTRDWVYLYYVIYAVTFSLTMLALKGLGFQYLWSESLYFQEKGFAYMGLAALIFAGLFLVTLMEIRQRLPVVFVIYSIIAVCAIVLIGLMEVISFQLIVEIFIGLMAFGAVCAIGAGIVLWYQGMSRARYFTIAWVSFLVGAAAFGLSKIQLLPHNLFTENAILMGAVLEVVLLSLALAERINEERRESAMHLQDKVEERTLELQQTTEDLESANSRLRKLNTEDPLTKLKNRSYFNTRLKAEWIRACRDKSTLSLLMVDIDFFKQINDSYGHLLGDECIKETTKVIQGAIKRPHDCVARYGGEEFVALLPSTEQDGAEILAERIREAVEHNRIERNGDMFCMTVSIGICSAVPTLDMKSETLIKAADIALYKAKEHGRNQVAISAIDDDGPMDMELVVHHN